MLKRFLCFSIFALLLGLSAVLAQDTEKTFTIGAQEQIRVATIAGNISITAWDNAGQVQVKATVEGDHVQPEYEQKDGILIIKEKHEKTTGVDHGAVHFTIFVPRDVKIESKSVSGNIHCEGTSGSLELKTVSGNVEMTTAHPGEVKLASVSGNIISVVKEELSASLNLKTVSGDIELSLPAGADARFSAKSLSGKIDCTARLGNVEKEEGHVSHSLSGVLGTGRGEINASTVSGNITVH